MHRRAVARRDDGGHPKPKFYAGFVKKKVVGTLPEEVNLNHACASPEIGRKPVAVHSNDRSQTGYSKLAYSQFERPTPDRQLLYRLRGRERLPVGVKGAAGCDRLARAG
jgi:hypothetical protein